MSYRVAVTSFVETCPNNSPLPRSGYGVVDNRIPHLFLPRSGYSTVEFIIVRHPLYRVAVTVL